MTRPPMTDALTSLRGLMEKGADADLLRATTGLAAERPTSHERRMSASFTVGNLETEKSMPQRATIDVVRRCLETAGIEPIPENGGGSGARFRNRADGTRGEHRRFG